MAETTTTTTTLEYAAPVPCTQLASALGTPQSTWTTALAPRSSNDATADHRENGCAMRLSVAHDGPGAAVALVEDVESELRRAVVTQLRSPDGTRPELALARVGLGIDDPVAHHHRRYAIDLTSAAATLDGERPPSSEMILHGTACDHVAGKALAHEILPEATVRVVAGDLTTVDCVMELNVATTGPRLASARDAAAFLEGIDERLTHANAALGNVSMQFYAPNEAPLLLAARGTSTSASNVNAPSKQVTLGILSGAMLLCAMLFAVVFQKKRHELQCQERYDNASRAAQIRRVSYRMSYEPVAKHDFLADQEEEEKDGLL